MASRALSSGVKLVWQKHLYLDDEGKGCRMSAENVGALLGLRADTVDAHRRTLQRAGLLDRGETKGKGATWACRFPGELLPQSQRPSIAEYRAAGLAFDRVLCSRGIGSDAPDSTQGKPPDTPEQATGKIPVSPESNTVKSEVRSLASVRGEGGRGEGTPPSPARETSLLRSTRISDGGDVSMEERTLRVARASASSASLLVDGGSDRAIGTTDGGESHSLEDRRRAWREGLRGAR